MLIEMREKPPYKVGRLHEQSANMRSARLAALSMCGASALLVWQTVLLSLHGGYMRMGSASVHASAVPAFDATR